MVFLSGRARDWIPALSPLMLFALCSAPIFAQHSGASATAAEPAFEFADVHPSPPSTYPPFRHDGYLVGDRYALRQATMLDMISAAYGVNRQDIRGGPSWLDWNRFDVIAMAPATTPAATVKLMLRSLLKERFGLVVQQGTAQMPAWILTVADGAPKMKSSDGSGKPGCQRQSPAASSESGLAVAIEISCHNEDMQRFAGEVRYLAPSYLDRPVVDSTGLKGSWNFDFQFTPRNGLKQAGAAAISMFDAVQNQLGLKLTLGTAPAQALTVTRVNENPTPNLPDVEKHLPREAPAQLEVSVVRPATLGEEVRGGFGGDRIDVHAFTLQELINFAWFRNPETGGVVVGAPKWLDKDRFDIEAKISGGGAANIPSNFPRMDRNQFQELIRGLLEDRFRLKVHVEDRPVTTYALVAVDPKMAPAKSSERTGCEIGLGASGKDPELKDPALDRLVTCRNITMAQFGEALRDYKFGYFYFPVQDATGLKGAYDFTLSFTSLYRLQPRAPFSTPSGTSAANMPAASEPSGALSLYDAVRRELGLKLEKVQRPEPVLVIDHVDEQPTPN
jgi:uncharacterized protein (TIGR03435 family)